jgi:hypothetical protein
MICILDLNDDSLVMMNPIIDSFLHLFDEIYWVSYRLFNSSMKMDFILLLSELDWVNFKSVCFWAKIL